MDDPLTVRISSLEHYMYCPRQCGLIDVEGQWVDNRHTIRGQALHRRADSGESRMERGRRVLRSIPLWSERWGLEGRADVVEVRHDALVPVEYKAGFRHGRAADVQLCAQALCLEEMFGLAVPEGAVWFAGPRRRVRVAIDDDLRALTVGVILEVRRMIESGVLPTAPDDERCGSCQLIERCLPSISGHPSRAGQLAAALLEGVE